MRRATFFALHSWVGIKLMFVLGVILLTGTFATLSHEIDWLVNPALRVTPERAPVQWGKMVRNVQAAYPEAVIHSVTGPRHPWHAAEIVVTLAPDAYRERIYANPYSGDLTGHAGWMSVQRFFRDFHMMLFLPRIGLYVVSAFGFLLLVSLVTGLIAYKRFWRGFFKMPRSGQGARVLWGDLHRLMAVWSIWFVAIIAITGIWYFVEMGLYDAGKGLNDMPLDPPPASIAVNQKAPDIDTLLAMAARAYPGFQATGLNWPHAPGQALDVVGESDVVLVRERANRVYLDLAEHRVLAVRRGDELPLLYRWVHTADPLHFGNFGGLLTQLIWFVFGCLLTAMTFSGAWLWLKRTNKKLRTARAVAMTARVANANATAA